MVVAARAVDLVYRVVCIADFQPDGQLLRLPKPRQSGKSDPFGTRARHLRAADANPTTATCVDNGKGGIAPGGGASGALSLAALHAGSCCSCSCTWRSRRASWWRSGEPAAPSCLPSGPGPSPSPHGFAAQPPAPGPEETRAAGSILVPRTVSLPCPPCPASWEQRRGIPPTLSSISLTCFSI